MRDGVESLHHGHQFGGRLPRVERHDDDAFGHQRKVQRGPANAVRREKRAAIAFLQSAREQKVARLLRSCASNSLPVTEYDLSIANFAAAQARSAAFCEPLEDLFEERHAASRLRCALRAGSAKPGLSGGR